MNCSGDEKEEHVMTRGNYPSPYHELNKMSTYDIPPRTAEVLWELAKERKKIHAERKERQKSTPNEIPADRMKLPESGVWGNSRDPEHPPVYERNIPVLLHGADISETPMLPLSLPLLVLQVQQR